MSEPTPEKTSTFLRKHPLPQRNGLGASGLFSRVGANAMALVAEDHVIGNAYWGPTLQSGFWDYWLHWLGFGALVGGFVSALLAGRLKSGIDRGALISPRVCVLLAVFGGALVGFATRHPQCSRS